MPRKVDRMRSLREMDDKQIEQSFAWTLMGQPWEVLLTGLQRLPGPPETLRLEIMLKSNPRSSVEHFDFPADRTQAEFEQALSEYLQKLP